MTYNIYFPEKPYGTDSACGEYRGSRDRGYADSGRYTDTGRGADTGTIKETTGNNNGE